MHYRRYRSQPISSPGFMAAGARHTAGGTHSTLKTELMFPFPARSGALWAVGAQFMTPSDGNVGRGWAEPARWETVPAAEFHPRCLHFLKNREGTEWLH